MNLTTCACPAVPPNVWNTLAAFSQTTRTLVPLFALFEYLLQSRCDFADPCLHKEQYTAVNKEKFDFIVVGGGTAGSIVASELSQHSNVLVIEAGGEQSPLSQVPSMVIPNLATEINSIYRSESSDVCGETEWHCYWHQGKVLGGTHVLNALYYIIGNREDYDNWEKLGNKNWKFDDIKQYFEITNNGFSTREHNIPVEDYSHRPELIYRIIEGAKKRGYSEMDLTAENTTGYMLLKGTVHNGKRASSASTLFRPNLKEPKFMLNTIVSKVLFNKNKRAIGVQIVDSQNNTKNLYVEKEVILSAGAINTPKILMLSGVGSRKQLRKFNITSIAHLPGVGKNLNDHPSFPMPYIINEKYKNVFNINNIKQYVNDKNGPLAGIGLTSLTLKMSSKFANKSRGSDLQIAFRGYLPDHEEKNETSMRATIINVQPKSRGYIKLNSTNFNRKPKIYSNFLKVPNDTEVILEGIKIFKEIAESDTLKDYIRIDDRPIEGCVNYTFDSDDYWICAIKYTLQPLCHLTSTCKMGPKHDKMAVVDDNLRVYRVKNLRVIDASIMPTVTSANTLAPVLMIGRKGAAMIKSQYGFK